MLILAACSSGGNPEGSPPVSPTPDVSEQPPGSAPSSTPEPGSTPSSPPDPNPGTEDAREENIDSMIEDMSLEEKIGQLIVAGVEGSEPNEQTRRMIVEQHVGGIIFFRNNLADPASIIQFVNQVNEWNQVNHAPLLLSVDQEGGRVSRFNDWVALPSALQIGESSDPELASLLGFVLGEGVDMMGMNMNFAPVLDVNSNPANPVIGDRSFGDDPEQVSTMGIKVMQHIKQEGVIPVVKHFPGHGDTDTDSHLDLPVILKTEDELDSLELKPFADAIDAGADVVMVAHILFPALDEELPSSLSPAVITDQLRNKLGFDGVVITDDLTMRAIANRYGMGEAAVLSLKAGTDILLVAHKYENVDEVITYVKKAVDEGTLTEKRIEESVRRILQLKADYDLHDEPREVPDLSSLNEQIRDLNKRTSAANR